MLELHRMGVDEYKQVAKLPVTVVLDNVRSEMNVGSVFRTADAFRLNSVVLCGICCCPKPRCSEPECPWMNSCNPRLHGGSGFPPPDSRYSC